MARAHAAPASTRTSAALSVRQEQISGSNIGPARTSLSTARGMGTLLPVTARRRCTMSHCGLAPACQPVTLQTPRQLECSQGCSQQGWQRCHAAWAAGVTISAGPQVSAGCKQWSWITSSLHGSAGCDYEMLPCLLAGADQCSIWMGGVSRSLHLTQDEVLLSRNK